jgi:hypothetical protein
LNYDDEKTEISFSKHLATVRGTKLHELADNCIKLKIHLPNNNESLNSYVNDAINLNMTTEQTLCYSDNAFGTCDAISFKNNILRIHDLKTGGIPASFKQLEIYAALFCLEYEVDPNTIIIELRIYQNSSVLVKIPTSEIILYIMEKIRSSDKIINRMKLEVANEI